jgi:hypothetical protein
VLFGQIDGAMKLKSGLIDMVEALICRDGNSAPEVRDQGRADYVFCGERLERAEGAWQRGSRGRFPGSFQMVFSKLFRLFYREGILYTELHIGDAGFLLIRQRVSHGPGNAGTAKVHLDLVVVRGQGRHD